ncbi:MAG: hypothetical protein V2I62_04960 [Bacteroidales bacterium]|jgi:hypothetical protein|nr:hypothetical protein [Bacteroidales bacterium]
MCSKLFNKPFLSFLTGVLFSGILITSYAFINESALPQDAIYQSVTLNDAVALTKEYAKNAQPLDKVFKGFAVNLDQFAAMNKIYQQNQNVSGFRLYSGETRGGDKKSIIVGISASGKDETSGTIYSAPVFDSGPCPTVCDTHSPLN